MTSIEEDVDMRITQLTHIIERMMQESMEHAAKCAILEMEKRRLEIEVNNQTEALNELKRTIEDQKQELSDLRTVSTSLSKQRDELMKDARSYLSNQQKMLLLKFEVTTQATICTN